ncbi:hypothetical protein H8S37_04020 [Mediterraneibacter sp. NSJ-55]|uniref:Uncharacterized protein n=1 Tax=Mediterraneibacter hominis TaxID=2763054 RepID=A0A923LGX9_9FIRM|nr:hypothetical protein [Mediterraneibacter hominis]MBC5688100.1 hypothetical protein [Mediterraneibacter hominis]
MNKKIKKVLDWTILVLLLIWFIVCCALTIIDQGVVHFLITQTIVLAIVLGIYSLGLLAAYWIFN